jgi:hypothetical protein
MINNTERVFLNGGTDKDIRDNGLMDNSMEEVL